MPKKFDIAVVGATGAVGEIMLQILAARDFPVGKVYALASARSVGNTVDFGHRQLPVDDLLDFDFSKVQIGLFSAGGTVSAEHAPRAAAAGCVVIDNTSHFRRDDDIPLVVPEVNPEAIAGYKARGIIANPNCSTIQMLVALKPIYDVAGIERINVATYQAVSGAGVYENKIEGAENKDEFNFSNTPIDLGNKKVSVKKESPKGDYDDNINNKKTKKGTQSAQLQKAQVIDVITIEKPTHPIIKLLLLPMKFFEFLISLF